MSVQHAADDLCTTVTVAHDVASVPGTRHRMRDELRHHGVGAGLVGDAVLVLTELLTNAVEHGEPNDAGEVEVSWCVAGQTLRLSVVDGGDVADLEPLPPTPDCPGGRGLHLVDVLCDNWAADNHHGTRVTAELSA